MSEDEDKTAIVQLPPALPKPRALPQPGERASPTLDPLTLASEQVTTILPVPAPSMLQPLALPSFETSASDSMIDRLRLAEEELARLHAAAEKPKAPVAEEVSTQDLLDDVEVEEATETQPAALDHLQEAPKQTHPTELALSLVDVTKSYFKGNLEMRVLDGLDLEVPLGSFVALMGPSGSGKSTLLHLIAGLDRPTAGSIRVAGADLGSMSEEQLSHWRARNVGFIFQHYNLLPVLTAAHNVELPLLLRKDLKRKERAERVRIALRVVGLEDRLDYYPRELSGGQEQRVAIARAIVSDPKILICDEPTGDLDRVSADAILDLLALLNREHGKTIFLVTHDPEAAERATSRRLLSKGKLI